MASESQSNVSTLVFVDDDRITNLLVERFLKDSGCNVVTFTEPSEAYEFLLANKVNVLVVDLRMPKRDGIEFLQSLQQQPVQINRIIVQTGAEPEPQVRETIESMGYELVLKDEMLRGREELQNLLNYDS